MSVGLVEPKEEFEKLWKKYGYSTYKDRKTGEEKLPWHRSEVKQCYRFFMKGLEYAKW